LRDVEATNVVRAAVTEEAAADVTRSISPAT
jgi:hypothetical protein